jgi:hypothetical protein
VGLVEDGAVSDWPKIPDDALTELRRADATLSKALYMIPLPISSLHDLLGGISQSLIAVIDALDAGRGDA